MVEYFWFKLVTPIAGFGISVGMDAYRSTKTFAAVYNTLPISLNGIYWLNPSQKGLFAGVYLGYAFKFFGNFEKGLNSGSNWVTVFIGKK